MPAKVMTPQTHIVPGDILVLQSGDLVPADCIVLTSSSLSVSQSLLTGEVIPVEKSSVASVHSPEKDEIDSIHKSNVILCGTSSATGQCIALAISTGTRMFCFFSSSPAFRAELEYLADTYTASLSSTLNTKRATNSFQKSILRISYLLIGFMGVMVLIVPLLPVKAFHHILNIDSLLSFDRHGTPLHPGGQ